MVSHGLLDVPLFCLVSFVFFICLNITRTLTGAEHNDGWWFCWTFVKTILCLPPFAEKLPWMNDVFPIEHIIFPLLPMSTSPLHPSNHVRESVRISSPTSGTSSATLPRFLTRFLRDDKSKVDQTTKIEAGHDCCFDYFYQTNQQARKDRSIFLDISWISFFCFGRKEPN